MAIASATFSATTSGEIVNGQTTMANSIPVVIASDQAAIPITGTITATNPSVGTTGTTVPTSGTYIAGTKSGVLTGLVLDVSSNLNVNVNAALPAGSNVIGALSANQSVNVSQVNGNTTATGNGITGTGTQRVTISSDSTGQVALATGSNTIGALTANQSVNMAQIAGTNTVTGGVAGLLAIAGNVASAGSDSGNPVKIGGIFNTTQPTVTTGQRVDAQMTNRGAQIVSTGVDTFNVTINAALPAGANTIGAVTQASGPWTSNVTQIGGSAISTAASGTQKVGITGNTGAAMDAAGQNAASPANELLIAGQFNTTPTTISSGNISPLQLDSSGNTLVNLKTAIPSGSNVIGALTANQSVNVAQVAGSTTSTAASGTQLVGIADGSGNKITTNSTTYTSKFGADVNILGTLGTAFSTAGKVDVKGADGDVFVRQATAGNLNATVVGQATGSAVPANAFYSGNIGKTSLPTAVSDAQLVGAMADKFGRHVALVSTIRDLVVTQTTTISASTSETTIGTQVASVFLDIVMLIVSNTSTATNTRIDFRDTTAGSVLFSLQSVGGATPIGFSLATPIPQTSVNTNWTATTITSTTDVRIYFVACKNK